MALAELSFALFALLNLGRTLAYVPQIVSICRDTNGATAVSIVTWSTFAAAHAATVAYIITASNDAVMAGVFALNAFGCALIALLAACKRAQHRRQCAARLRS